MRNNLERIGANTEVQNGDPLPQAPTDQALNFIVPTEHVSLPSKGKFYPPNHPLRDKETIEVKQMTAKEEDILTSRNLLKKGLALDKLIQSIIVDKKINTDSITIEDRSAIILAARISAYGADYNTTVTCPSCNEKSKNSFNLLEKLDAVDKVEHNIVVDNFGLITLILPATKWVVKCRALNGYDEKAVMRLSETKKSSNAGDSLLIEQLKMMIVSINDAMDKEVIETAINSMPARDSRYLRNTYQEVLKGIDMRHSFSCPKCEYVGELEVPMTADFFWFK